MKQLKDKKWLYKQYWVNERSIGSIAKELDTYPNKIRRELLKIAAERGDIKLRDKGQAQKIALISGRSSHPTQGKERSEATKLKISEKVAENWENLSDEEMEARRESARQQWKNMSPAEKEKLRQASVEGLHKAAKEGSKLEKYLCNQLTNAGYMIEYHKRGLVPNSNLEVDIYVPELATAIEVDGIFHFEAIHSEEALRKTIVSDNEKNGLLRYIGVMVIRVAQKRKTLSHKVMRDTWNAIEAELNQIAKKMPPKNERYKEIVV